MRLTIWLLLLTLPTGALQARAARAAEDESRTLVHQGIERRYVLHVPSALSGPHPLIIALHGLTHEKWSLFNDVADREGFVVAYPEAVDGRWSYWRGGRVMLPGSDTQEIDDVGFIIAVLDKLVGDGIAEPSRIFITGTSRGALMTWTLACQHPEHFVAAAPLLSGMTDIQAGFCAPARALPIIAVAGTADPIQPYDGGLSPSTPRLFSIPETMEFWRRAHGCTGQTIRELPHRNRSDLTRTQVVEWTGCRAGPVLLYKVVNGGHLLPSITPETNKQSQIFGRRGEDFDTPEEIWQVFRDLKWADGSVDMSISPNPGPR